ncbi:transcriptional regulator with XRE-family HTH domain [Pedobacter sp. CAN_A7]|uniref:helix-turn-helix domain-containing protein n=1 Tax=Pedobacter sp. CAN_A7 TaxID=2787722 RepID=UPI0018CA05EF
MKNLSNSVKIASSLRRLREERGYDVEKVAFLLGLKEKEYNKLERGTRELNLQQLCLLAELYQLRKSLVIDYGNPKNLDSNEMIEFTLKELEIATQWLTLIRKRVAELELKIDKQRRTA